MKVGDTIKVQIDGKQVDAKIINETAQYYELDIKNSNNENYRIPKSTGYSEEFKNWFVNTMGMPIKNFRDYK
jgi:hypothetical protein